MGNFYIAEYHSAIKEAKLGIIFRTIDALWDPRTACLGDKSDDSGTSINKDERVERMIHTAGSWKESLSCPEVLRSTAGLAWNSTSYGRGYLASDGKFVPLVSALPRCGWVYRNLWFSATQWKTGAQREQKQWKGDLVHLSSRTRWTITSHLWMPGLQVPDLWFSVFKSPTCDPRVPICFPGLRLSE